VGLSTASKGVFSSVSLFSRGDLYFVRVSIQSYFELAKGSCLHLVCVLELFNPVGLLPLKTGYLGLDRHPPLVFFVNAAD